MTDKDQPNLSRRDFFRRGAKAALEVSDTRSLELAKLWFRPPFALDEIAFLDTCTQCGKCIAACPPKALFPLSSEYGLRAVDTPALDLINKACLLCEDWLCVAACEPQALVRQAELSAHDDQGEDDPEVLGDVPLKPMALAEIDTENCLPFAGPECGACSNSCPVEGALLWDGPKPRINADSCVGCGLCRQICITQPRSIKMVHVIQSE